MLGPLNQLCFRLETGECSLGITESIHFKPESLQHRNVQLGKFFVAILVEGKMLAMLKTTACQQDRQISRVVTAGIA